MTFCDAFFMLSMVFVIGIYVGWKANDLWRTRNEK